jgi:hypothetical protein
MAVYVALGIPMLSRSNEFIKHLIPILNWLVVHFDNDMPYDRRADTFVGNGEMNVGPIAAIELENWPYRRAHLLALHVCGVSRNTQSEKSNKGRDDQVVSAGTARLLFLRHGADDIAAAVSVNQSGG